MCTNHLGPKQVATEDIVCYKHIMKQGRKYATSYQETPIIFRKIITSNIIVENEYGETNKRTWINIGLHSYICQKAAESQALSLDEVLVKCVIPKGSEYYKGEFLGDPTYVSNQLIYKKVIKNYNIEES